MRVCRRGGFQRGQCRWSRVSFPSEAISEVLKTNSTLASIKLAHNNIGDEGAEARWVSGRSDLLEQGFFPE